MSFARSATIPRRSAATVACAITIRFSRFHIAYPPSGSKARHRVLTGDERAGPAQPVEQGVEGDEGRCAAQPGVERAVEVRIGPAVHERDGRQARRIEAEVGLDRKPALGREARLHELLEFPRVDHVHGDTPSFNHGTDLRARGFRRDVADRTFSFSCSRRASAAFRTYPAETLAQSPKNRYDPTSFSSTATGGSSHRPLIWAVKASNAADSRSGLLPSVASSDTMWTKLTPSFSLKEA